MSLVPAGGRGVRSIRNKAVSKSERAGLIFPVGRIGRYLKKGRYCERLSSTAAVYMASVLEFCAAEVLLIAKDAAIDNNKKRITPRHINLAVRDDLDVKELFKDVIIPNSGVFPNINPALLQKKKYRRRSAGDRDDAATPSPRRSPHNKAAKKTTAATKKTTTATKRSTKKKTSATESTPKKTIANKARASNAPPADA